MTWVRETEHAQKALDARAGPFQVPGVANILEPLTNQIQEIENVAWQIFDARFVATATGDALEILGAIVGENDTGGTDADFRQRISLKLAAINSDRTERAFLELFSLIEGSTWSVSSSPGWVTITQRMGPVMDSAMLLRMAKIASADGVLVRFTSYEDATENLFTWPSQDGTITGGEWASQDGSIEGYAWPGAQIQL